MLLCSDTTVVLRRHVSPCCSPQNGPSTGPIFLPNVIAWSHARSQGLSRLKKEALLAIGYSLRRDQIRDLSLTFRALDKVRRLMYLCDIGR